MMTKWQDRIGAKVGCESLFHLNIALWSMKDIEDEMRSLLVSPILGLTRSMLRRLRTEDAVLTLVSLVSAYDPSSPSPPPYPPGQEKEQTGG